MNSCCGVILLLGIIRGRVVGLDRKGIRIGTVVGIEVIKDDNEVNTSEHSIRNENVGIMSLEKANRDDKRSAESMWRCGDDQSYYFEPLNECYRISLAEFLNTDPGRKIAYGGTRNEYMLNCWQQYRGKLLDIGSSVRINLKNFENLNKIDI